MNSSNTLIQLKEDALIFVTMIGTAPNDAQIVDSAWFQPASYVEAQRRLDAPLAWNDAPMFIAELYHNAVGRAPDPVGLAYWEGIAAHNGFEAVIMGIAFSAETIQHNAALVARF